MRDPKEIQAAIDDLRMQEASADRRCQPTIAAAIACVVSALCWTLLQESDFEEALGESAKVAVN